MSMTFPKGLKIKVRPRKSLPHTPEMVISSAHGYGNKAPNLYIFANKWLQPPNKYIYIYSTLNGVSPHVQPFLKKDKLFSQGWNAYEVIPGELKLSAMQKNPTCDPMSSAKTPRIGECLNSRRWAPSYK